MCPNRFDAQMVVDFFLPVKYNTKTVNFCSDHIAYIYLQRVSAHS